MEQILERLGNPGKYHVLIVCLFAITWWSVTLGTVSMAFYGHEPQKSCNVGDSLRSEFGLDSDANVTAIANNTGYRWRDGSNITVIDKQCSYSVLDENGTSAEYQCRSWTYDDEGRGTATVTSDFNLVCENKYRVSLSSTLFFVGVFCGALIFGIISDHLGRKKTLAISLYSQIIVSFVIAFLPNWTSFTIIRFLLGVLLQGISTVAFVHCIELYRQKYRGVVMAGFGMSWAFAQLLAALFAYIFPNWRHMQMASACLALVTLPYFWWLPESPRWLLVKGRVEEIVEVFIFRAAKMNGLNVKETMNWCSQQLDGLAQQQITAASVEQKQTFKNIMVNRVLRTRLIAMCFMWCVASLAYYVFIFNTQNLAGNVYLNFAIGAALEVGVNVCIIFVMAKLGRRRPLLVCCTLLAIFCIISGTVPKKYGEVNIGWIVTMFALFGKMAIASVMSLIFVYAAELFPTFARGSCLALCGCSLRVGGMLAPQVIFLRSIVFPEFPFIIVAALIFACGVVTYFLPETFGSPMPNTIDEAVNMSASAKYEDSVLLSESAKNVHALEHSSASDTSSNSTNSTHDEKISFKDSNC